MLMLGWDSVPQWEPLLADFISLAGQLDELGLTYNKGKVTIVELSEEQKNV